MCILLFAGYSTIGPGIHNQVPTIHAIFGSPMRSAHLLALGLTYELAVAQARLPVFSATGDADTLHNLQ